MHWQNKRFFVNNTFIVPVLKNKYFLKNIKIDPGGGGRDCKEEIFFPAITPS